MEQNKNHSLSVEYKQGLTASGISDVLSSNDREAILSICGGGKVKISGENLKIIGFDKVSCNFKMSGFVLSVRYSAASQSPLKNLFK
ncbi:MAG TPA: hypothetical protein DDW54_00680 [Clostridiales bacterium]|nr:hypothetical protein [Clostridiales bacterium]